MAVYHNESTISDLFDHAQMRITPRQDPINVIQSIARAIHHLGVSTKQGLPANGIPILNQHFGIDYSRFMGPFTLSGSIQPAQTAGLSLNIESTVIIAHKDSLHPPVQQNTPLKLEKCKVLRANKDNLNQSIDFEAQLAISGDNGPIVTGVLLNENRILTCGHLIQSVLQYFGFASVHHAVQYITQHYCAIRGFYLLGNNLFAAQEVLNITGVPYQENIADPSLVNVYDMALLEYTSNNPVKTFPSIAKDPIPDGREVYCLGFGYGQPMKLSLNGHSYFGQSNASRCKLIIRPGNSGSPVFDAATHELVGVIHGTFPAINDFSVIHLDNRPWQDLTGYDGAIFTKIWGNQQTQHTNSLQNLFSQL